MKYLKKFESNNFDFLKEMVRNAIAPEMDDAFKTEYSKWYIDEWGAVDDEEGCVSMWVTVENSTEKEDGIKYIDKNEFLKQVTITTLDFESDSGIDDYVQNILKKIPELLPNYFEGINELHRSDFKSGEYWCELIIKKDILRSSKVGLWDMKIKESE